MNQACTKSLDRLRESALAVQADTEENLVAAESRLKAKNDVIVKEIRVSADAVLDEFRIETLKSRYSQRCLRMLMAATKTCPRLSQLTELYC